MTHVILKTAFKHFARCVTVVRKNGERSQAHWILMLILPKFRKFKIILKAQQVAIFICLYDCFSPIKKI